MINRPLDKVNCCNIYYKCMYVLTFGNWCIYYYVLAYVHCICAGCDVNVLYNTPKYIKTLATTNHMFVVMAQWWIL